MALGSTQPLVKMSTRNIRGGKGGLCVRLTSPLSRAECHEIWEPKPPGTLWTTPGLLRDSFAFFMCMYVVRTCNCKQSNVTVILRTSSYNTIFKIKQITMFTECKSGTTQTLPFGVNATIDLKNVITTSDTNSTLVSWSILRQMTIMSLLLGVVVFFELNCNI
jgi:hypothetical protein